MYKLACSMGGIKLFKPPHDHLAAMRWDDIKLANEFVYGLNWGMKLSNSKMVFCIVEYKFEF